MPDDARGLRAVYDHEEDQPRRRRRPVADWGVGDDVFDHMPRNRFARDDHPRRGAHERMPRADVAAADDAPWAREAPRDVAPAEDEPWAREAPRDVVPAEDEPWATVSPADDTGVVPDRRPRVVSPDGRRTVVIGGRPGEPVVDRSRRRPPRTAHERLGPRPDRIVAWIVALGVLLILIALLS
jgi:hypothetical protein